MKNLKFIPLVFILFFSGTGKTDTIPNVKIPIIAKEITARQVDSIVKNHKPEWYLKERTWLPELIELLNKSNELYLLKYNETNKNLVSLDSTTRALDSSTRVNNALINDKLNLIVEIVQLKEDKDKLKRTNDLLTSAPHILMGFALMVVAVLTGNRLDEKRKEKRCGKMQRSK